MSEVKYDDPEYLSKKKPSVLCVICSYIPKGQTRDYRFVDKEGCFVSYTENKLESLKFTLAAYEHYKTGIDYDIVVVDNDSQDEVGRKFVEEYKYPEKNYKWYRRENKGYSFGAFKWTWENIKGYDYYLFQEQDMVPAKDNWLKEIFNLFNSDRNIGAVGNVVETRATGDDEAKFNINFFEKYLPHRKWCANLDGPFTFTSRRVLQQVDKHGGLEVFDISDKLIDPSVNECIFQHLILELGYRLEPAGRDGKHIFSHGVMMVEQTGEGEVAPMLHAHCRYFWAAKYFSWYEGVN